MDKNFLINDVLSLVNEKDETFNLEDFRKNLDIMLSNYQVKKQEAKSVGTLTIPLEVDYFLKALKIEGKSPKTLDSYRIYLNNMFKKVQKEVKEVTTNDIRTYLYDYQQERQISNRSLENMRCCFSSFFKWCQNNDYIIGNPMGKIAPIAFNAKPREGITRMELAKLREACENPRERALLEFMYSTGCRVSEVSAVKKSDINFDNKTVMVLGKGNKYRNVYLNAEAELALIRYFESRNDDSEYAFVSLKKPYNPIKKASIEVVIKQMVLRTDIDKKITPHMIRHTTATVALQGGMDVTEVQKLLGHSNINTTMIYAKVDEQELSIKASKIIN